MTSTQGMGIRWTFVGVESWWKEWKASLGIGQLMNGHVFVQVVVGGAVLMRSSSSSKLKTSLIKLKKT